MQRYSIETEPESLFVRSPNWGIQSGLPMIQGLGVRISLLVCVAGTLLTGCYRNPQPSALGAPESAFNPLIFFDGHVRSWGVVESRSGAPTGWVVTDCEGRSDGPDRLRMVQHLSFGEGPMQERIWTLQRTGPQRFQATANDMVGTAIGEADGRALHWKWVLAPSRGGWPFEMTIDQWMYQIDDRSVLIRTKISKLGVILAEVSEQFTSATAEVNSELRTYAIKGSLHRPEVIATRGRL